MAFWRFDGSLFGDRSCTINKGGNMTKGKTTNKIKDQKDGDYTNTCRQVRSRCLPSPGGGCYKLYICETRDDIEVMLHCGYEAHDMKYLKPLWVM